MSRNFWQQGVAILLVFLFLGPMAISLLHEHDSDHIDHCNNKEEAHFHDFAHAPSCFICSFSLSTFQVNHTVDLVACDLIRIVTHPNPIYENFHPLLISRDHAPRGPPFLS